MKTLLQRLALCLCAITVSLLIAEGMVRTLIYMPVGTPYVAENPDTIYFNMPGITGRHCSPGEFDYIFHTNSRGLRSPEIPTIRTGHLRILCLGDSFTFGIGGTDSESWPMQLKALLPDSNVEIINAGVMGWGLAEYWIWLNLEGLQYQPDLVIIGCHASDWENAGNGLVTLDHQSRLKRHPVLRRDIGRLKKLTNWIPFYSTLMSHSALANYLKQTVIRITQQGTTKAPAPIAPKPVNNPVPSLAFLNEAILRQIKSDCAAVHSKLLLAYIPKFGALNPSTDSDATSRQFHDDMEIWTQRNGVVFVDTTSALQDVVKRDSGGAGSYYHLIDGHCKPTGYGVIAGSIANFLKQHPDWLLPLESVPKSLPVSQPPPRSK